MVKIEEMSETITFFEQLEQEAGPIVLINRITVKPEEADQLLRIWTIDIDMMKGQPGFISAQLHQGIGGSMRLSQSFRVGISGGFKTGI